VVVGSSRDRMVFVVGRSIVERQEQNARVVDNPAAAAAAVDDAVGAVEAAVDVAVVDAVEDLEDDVVLEL